MSILRRNVPLTLALLLFLCFATRALAQDAVTEFASGDEEMKYRYLWMAYAAIWILVFAFVWRTWGKQQEADREIEDLRRRLTALEGDEHDG